MHNTGTLLLVLTAAACRPQTGSELPLTAAERAAIADSAVAVLREVFDDVHRLDGVAAAARYAALPEVVHVEDTVVLDGRDAIQQSFSAAIGSTTAIDSAAIDHARTIVLDRQTVVVVAPFQEIITLPDKKRYLDRGVWSNVVVRRPEGWRILAGHVSHASAGPTER